MKKSHLTREQRYEIQAYLKMNLRLAEIARQIGKHHSVISCEIKRNSDLNGKYRACYADDAAKIRKERLSRPRKMTHEMEVHIIEKIRSEQWSPEQIKSHAEANGVPMVSHESIYKIIRLDKNKGGDLYKNCRHKLKHRARPVGGKAVIIKDKRSIEERPAIVEERSKIGDWEVDTIVEPAKKGGILTIVYRKSGFFLSESSNKEKTPMVFLRSLLVL